MSLTEIAGHKFTDGLMRDRCSRCEIRWADAVAGRVTCSGHSMTDHYQAQFDQARQEMWDAVIGTSAGSKPSPVTVSDEPYDPEGDAAEPDASPYCFSWGNSAVSTGWTTPPFHVRVHKLPNGERVVEHLGLVDMTYCSIPEVITVGYPDSLTWVEILELLADR